MNRHLHWIALVLSQVAGISCAVSLFDRLTSTTIPLASGSGFSPPWSTASSIAIPALIWVSFTAAGLAVSGGLHGAYNERKSP